MGKSDVRSRTDADLVAELDRAHLWIVGLGLTEDDRLFGPAREVTLDLGECDCPGECRHDHENE